MSSRSTGNQSEHYIQWKEGLAELGLCRDIVKAVQGQQVNRSIRAEELEGLDEIWSHIKREVRKIDENPGERERIEKFLKNDSKKLEKLVAYLIGAHFIARDAYSRMKEAREQAPSHTVSSSNKFDLQSQARVAENIDKQIKSELKQIENGIKHIDRRLREEYEETRDEDLREEIRFMEDLAQAIDEFLSSGKIRGRLGEEVKGFAQEEVNRVKEKEGERAERSRRKRGSDRRTGSFL